jgi:hypothetical protein
VYLDITGLSCYRLNQIPAWYDALDEGECWEAQARWWESIARNRRLSRSSRLPPEFQAG